MQQHSLSGDISTMSVSDLTIFLGNKRASGRLQLARGRMKKSVVLRDGVIRSSASSDSRELLGQFLLTLGHITEDQFDKAYQTQKETKILLGKILIMTGQVTEGTVASTLTTKARETLLESFHWTDGSFAFDASVEPLAADETLVEVPLVDVHREGEFRREAWVTIRQALPNGGMRLGLGDSPPSPKPKPGSFDARLLALAAQGHTIDDLVLSLHATEFFLYQRLYALLRAGVVAITGTIASTAAPTPEAATGGTDVRALEERIGAFVADGKREEAERAMTQAAARHPNHNWSAVIERADARLLDTLRNQLAADRAIPTLLVPTKALFSLEVSAPARYLLSRVNGERSVEAIVKASPLPEAEGLRLFRELVTSKLVAMQTRGSSMNQEL